MDFLCLMSRYRNMGHPMNAVMTPTGRNVGAIMTLEMRSDTIRSTAPKTAEAGIK